MPRTLDTDAYPIGAGMAQPPERWQEIFTLADTAPKSVRDMIGSPHTAAFLRGLVKVYNLTTTQALPIAYAVLRVAIGEKTLAQLASMLSTDLKIANDKAQQMAQEIERELFVPIMLDYNKFIQSNKLQPARPLGGAQNVINLKQFPKPPFAPKPPQSKGPMRFTL